MQLSEINLAKLALLWPKSVDSQEKWQMFHAQPTCLKKQIQLQDRRRDVTAIEVLTNSLASIQAMHNSGRVKLLKIKLRKKLQANKR